MKNWHNDVLTLMLFVCVFLSITYGDAVSSSICGFSLGVLVSMRLEEVKSKK